MLRCASCGRENPDDARFCAGCGARLVEPPTVREERKVVTVVFADLVGSTARGDQADPEDVRAVLAPYHARLRSELERRGGTVEKFIGDAVVAVFGAPTAHEDDPERAVRAALGIQDAIAELNEADPSLELQVRVGVNTGEALVAVGARPEAGEGMVSGDVMNTGARLQAAAPPGGVLVGEQTFRATERAIEYADAEPVHAKGKAEPVAAWRALQPRSRFGVDLARAGGAPLVGRQQELLVLTGALARVRAERAPQLVTLVGVPGIGKSRLVYELMQSVEADEELIVWRQGRSLPYGEGVAFWALGEMAKAQAGILESDRADEAAGKLRAAVRELFSNEADAGWVERHLRPLVGLAREEAAGRERDDEAFAAWRRFFEALAETGPAVLVFEDLQWADDGLLEFVGELVDWVQGPLLVVCAARPELLEGRPGWAGGKRNAVTLSLSPLTEEDTARLLAALLDRSVLAAEVQSALLARAGGNPLYAEEYARMLALGDGAEIEVPETLQAIVSARIDALSSGEKALIQTGAVLGKVFWTDALTAVAGEGAAGLAEGLHALERKEFVRRERRTAVVGEQQYAFLHVLIRDAAYAQLTRGERAEKHRRAAEWLESLPADRSEDRAEMLAHHYRNALEYSRATGRLDRELEGRAGRAFREAGDHALALSAADAAVRFYEEALELEVGEPDPMLLFAHGRALSLLQRGEEELTRAAEALLAAGKAEAAAEAFCELSLAFWREGRIDDEEKYLDRAHTLIEDRPPSRAKAHVLAAVGRGMAVAGRSDLAIERAREALAIAEELGLDLVLGSALNNLGLAKCNLGDRSAIADLERSLEITRDLDAFEALRSYGNLSSTIFSFADVRRAFEYHQEGLDMARRVGLAGPIWWFVAEHAVDLYHLGRWDEALAHAVDYIAFTERTPHYMEGMARVARTKILLGRGDSVRALLDIDRSLQLAREMKDLQVVYPPLASAAVAFDLLGQSGRAAATADELLGLLRSGWRDALADTWVIDFAVVMKALGRESEVPDVLHPPTAWSDAAAAYTDGEFEHAAALLHEIGSLPAEAEARVRAAEAHAAAGRHAEADAQLDRALAFYRGVGATALIAEAERTLPPPGERRAARP